MMLSTHYNSRFAAPDSNLMHRISIYLTYKNSKYIKRVAAITLFLSIFSFGFISRAGYLGGQIRHTELSEPGSINPQFKAVEKEED